MKRLIAVLEEYFVYASTAKRLVDTNIAAGIALSELRRFESEQNDGQEAGSPTVPETKPF